MGSGNIFYVLLLVAVIVLIICAALQFGEVTVNKGHPTMIIVLCLLIPPAGYLLACALPDNTLREMIMRSTGNDADNRAGGERLPLLRKFPARNGKRGYFKAQGKMRRLP